MTQLNLNLPVIGGTNADEDPKIRTALSDIQTVVNALDNTNISGTADINGSKLADGTVSAAKLASNAAETAKIKDLNVTTSKLADDAVTADKLSDSVATDANRAVTTDHIRNSAVTTDKLNNGAVTGAKIASSTTATATNSSGVTGTLTARKYADGLVILEGSLTRSGGGNLGTLPSGYAPANTLTIPVATASATGVVTIVGETGAITSGIGGTVSLSHVSFHGG